MNIRSIANNLIPFEVRKLKKDAKAEASSERDANGKNEKEPQKQPRRNLSEEELTAALNHLKELKGVKDNNLNVRLVRQNGVPIVFVEDQKGNIVRRIPETELSLLDLGEKAKGNLLDKSL